MQSKHIPALTALLCILILAIPFGPAQARAVEPVPPQPPVDLSGPEDPYFTSSTLTLAGGISLEEMVISGPPAPPSGFEEAQPGAALTVQELSGFKLLPVPVYTWVFGCSAVSAAMIAGYYDRNGFPNMYTGPANGGVAPDEDLVWGRWADRYKDTYPINPLVASIKGGDGRTIRGSIDDYWVGYDSTLPDPYITGGWPEHPWGESVGDFMKTSQYEYENTDGSTRFYSYSSFPDRLYCSDMEMAGIHHQDGTYGLKLFFEARGYTVGDCYNQKTDNTITGGFSFEDYKAEIDAGHPVLIHLRGHTVAGVGYQEDGQKVILHDTWRPFNTQMTWGGRYEGMDLLSVSVVHPEPPSSPPGRFAKTAVVDKATIRSDRLTLSWAQSKGADNYEICIDTVGNRSCPEWIDLGTRTRIDLEGVEMGVTYYWQVRARNASGLTYANGGYGEFWSFQFGEGVNLYLPQLTR